MSDFRHEFDDETTDEPPRTVDPAAPACIHRTRSVVLNIVIASGLLLVIGGIVVRELDLGPPRFPEVPARRAAYGALIGLVFLSYGLRRVVGGRMSLRDPATRGPRFYLAHVLSAAIGALAIPLGIAYGILVRPDLQEIAPFWVAGMALGFLALPRGYELDDFDEPMIRPGTGSGHTADAPSRPARPRRPRR